jgi:hypothetical protein
MSAAELLVSPYFAIALAIFGVGQKKVALKREKTLQV